MPLMVVVVEDEVWVEEAVAVTYEVLVESVSVLVEATYDTSNESQW